MDIGKDLHLRLKRSEVDQKDQNAADAEAPRQNVTGANPKNHSRSEGRN